MATTTNYGWTTPDDTDLVKDGAAAIRTLGSSVDTTTKALNPSTTLGDIEYRSATANTNTRLGIGSTGNVLTVAGGVPTWAAPAGGGDVWTLLNAGGTALTGAQTVTISGISAKEKLMVLVQGGSSASAQSEICVRVNGLTTGTPYSTHGLSNVSRTSYGQDVFGRVGGNTNQMFLAGMSTDATSSVWGYCLITGCASSTSPKVYQINGGSSSETGNTFVNYAYGGLINTNNAITSVSIFSTSGNLDAGTVFVYANS